MKLKICFSFEYPVLLKIRVGRTLTPRRFSIYIEFSNTGAFYFPKKMKHYVLNSESQREHLVELRLQSFQNYLRKGPSPR